MGIFDSYGKQGVQLKIGDPSLHMFNEGDEVNIADGVYIGYEGAVVILNGKLAKVFNHLRDKWGGTVSVQSVLDPINPIIEAINSLKYQENPWKCIAGPPASTKARTKLTKITEKVGKTARPANKNK